MDQIDVSLRPALLADGPALACIHRLAREALGFVPNLHTPAQDLAFFEAVIESSSVMLAEENDEPTAFIALSRDDVVWIDHLYVHPDWSGRGIGSSLLDFAKRQNDELHLWTFAANTGARRFYGRHGFEAIDTADGSGNEENLPDIRYVWRQDRPTFGGNREQ